MPADGRPARRARRGFVFGELLVLALYQKYRQDGPAFVPRYLELLAAGGSDAPHVLLAKLGVDVTDPAFWELGLRLLDDMVGACLRRAPGDLPGSAVDSGYRGGRRVAGPAEPESIRTPC